MTGLARPLAIAAAFLLPLGAIGGIFGVALTAVHLLVFGRRREPADWHWSLALLPAAVLPIVTTIAAPNATPERTWYAVTLAGPLLLGWPAARRMVADAGHRHVATAFAAGASVLAASIVVDAVAGWHTIPSGLFPETLHNTAAALLVLAFPLALWLGAERPTPVAGVVATMLLIVGVLAALSWVGVLGVAAAGLVLVMGKFGWRGLFGGTSIAVVAISAGWSFAAVSDQPMAATLGEVLSSRARIFAEGLALAAQKPWLGWGVDPTGVGAALRSSAMGVFHVDDIALPHFHSLFVQTLAVAGVLGAGALVLALAFSLGIAGGPMRHAVRAALIGHLVTQTFDVAWSIASVVVSVGLVVALGATATDGDDQDTVIGTGGEPWPSD